MIPAPYLPWAWAIAAVVIACLEIGAPGYYLIWIALAAGLTAGLTALLDLGTGQQLFWFAASNVATCVAGFFIYRWLAAPTADEAALNRRDLDLVGATGTAAEPFKDGQGRVRIGDSLWLAESYSDLPVGSSVVVTGVRGTTLQVERRSPR